jgi:hypothetical protein
VREQTEDMFWEICEGNEMWKVEAEKTYDGRKKENGRDVSNTKGEDYQAL